MHIPRPSCSQTSKSFTQNASTEREAAHPEPEGIDGDGGGGGCRSARGPKGQGLNGKSTGVLCSDRVRSELASQLTAAAGLAYHIHHQFAEKAPVFYRTSPSARAALVHSSMQGLDRAVF
jgi:hypothetical protein